MLVLLFNVVDSTFKGCREANTQLGVLVQNGSGNYSYVWSPANLVDNPFIQNPVYTGQDASAILTVEVQDNTYGCRDTAGVFVTVNQPPSFSWYMNVEPACEKIDLIIGVRSQNKTLLTVSTTSTYAYSIDSIYTIIPLSSQGIYNVTIEGKDTTTGCSISIDTAIKVGNWLDSLILFYPNVISPNGDGFNDYLEFVLKEHRLDDCMKLQIYDRWGVLIFESQPPFYRWDGRTFSGEPVSPGTYYYILSLGPFKKHGFIQVIR